MAENWEPALASPPQLLSHRELVAKGVTTWTGVDLSQGKFDFTGEDWEESPEEDDDAGILKAHGLEQHLRDLVIRAWPALLTDSRLILSAASTMTYQSLRLLLPPSHTLRSLTIATVDLDESAPHDRIGVVSLWLAEQKITVKTLFISGSFYPVGFTPYAPFVTNNITPPVVVFDGVDPAPWSPWREFTALDSGLKTEAAIAAWANDTDSALSFYPPMHTIVCHVDALVMKSPGHIQVSCIALYLFLI